MYAAISCTGPGVFSQLAECIGACAHCSGDFDVGGVAVDELLQGFECEVVLFGSGKRLSNAQHGIGQSLAGGVVDDELLIFPRGIGIEAIVKDSLREFVMGVFHPGSPARRGGMRCRGAGCKVMSFLEGTYKNSAM